MEVYRENWKWKLKMQIHLFFHTSEALTQWIMNMAIHVLHSEESYSEWSWEPLVSIRVDKSTDPYCMSMTVSIYLQICEHLSKNMLSNVSLGCLILLLLQEIIVLSHRIGYFSVQIVENRVLTFLIAIVSWGSAIFCFLSTSFT